MKPETAEKLAECHILASPGKNIGGLIFTLLWAASFFGMEQIEFISEKYGETAPGIIIISVTALYWLGCPLFFGRRFFEVVWEIVPRVFGYLPLVILIMGLCLIFAIVVAYIAGLVIMCLTGILRPIFTAIAMAVYNNRVSKINAISGDLSPYLENDKFLKKVDKMSESIDFFREIGWLSGAKHEGFIRQYSTFASFLEFKESYEAGNEQSVG